MAVPRNRHSVSRRDSKRAHHAKSPKSGTACTNCKNTVLPHHACPSCGYYKGRSYAAKEKTSE